jgi:hypothetical protein
MVGSKQRIPTDLFLSEQRTEEQKETTMEGMMVAVLALTTIGMRCLDIQLVLVHN